MFPFTRGIRKLININYINSRSFILSNRNALAKRKEVGHLTTGSLSFRSYLVINSLSIQKGTIDYSIESKRYFAKKKGPKRPVEIEEDSDSEDEEEYEQSVGSDEMLGDNIVQKNVASLRLDSIIKAGLGLTKKKVEQEFYAFKLRVNGKPVVKKAMNVYVGDELDVINGYSPDTSKYLVVDRIIIKGIDKITGTGMFPVKMEVLKKLIIENYDEPWNPSSTGELDK